MKNNNTIKQNNKLDLNRRTSICSSVISFFITMIFIYILKDTNFKLVNKVMYIALFISFNFFIIYYLLENTFNIIKLFKLKNLKLNSFYYYLTPILNILLIATANLILFRITKINLNLSVQITIIVLTLIVFVLIQLLGAFPIKNIEDKIEKNLIKKSGETFKGIEALQSLTGSFDKGIIIATEAIEYKDIYDIKEESDILYFKVKSSEENIKYKYYEIRSNKSFKYLKEKLVK